MRATYLTVIALLLGTAAALAQQAAPPAQPAPPQVDLNRKLDAVLDGWEKAMSSLSSFEAGCTQITTDKANGAVETFVGTAQFVKGLANQPSRAKLKLVSNRNKQIYQEYICTGDFLYEFAPASKVIRVHKVPASKAGQIGDDNFLQFLFGMKAADAKNRYQMTYVPGDPKDRSTPFYHYILIKAKQPQDRADFDEARLTLMVSTLLPAQLWYRQPNGNTIQWDFTEVKRNVPIPLATFDRPRAQAGWKMEMVEAPRSSAAVPPTVVRPQRGP